MFRCAMRFGLAAALALAGAAFAAQDESKQDEQPLKSARKESLELPGVTACHTCEWRPMRKEMETDQCTTKIGVFDCGRDPECNNKCEFVKCSE